MADSYEDLRASDGTGNAVLAHVDVDRIVGATVLKLDTVENFPSEFILVTGTVLPNTYIDPNTQTEMRCHLSGSDVIIDTYEPGYTDVGNTEGQIAIIKMTTGWANRVVELAKVSHNDDGSIKDKVVGANNLTDTARLGWLNLGATPNTITNNGNRSYDLVFNSNDLTDTLSEGMRLKLTRTVTAPTQSTSLNGTTQYWSKSSPAGTTFTDDFCTGAWIYLTSYPSGTDSKIISRYNGTSGWSFQVQQSGTLILAGFNGGAANSSFVQSYQSVPLNKWVYVAAQLDMSAFTATTTTSYVMIDGVDVPATVTRAGTNPTALVQAGNLEVGSGNATNFFPGKIAQAWYSSAKITQTNIRTFMSQGITTSDISTHSIVSAFSFNGVATDINTTNANNLSATASAGYTSDSPFAMGSGAYETAGTTEYAIVSKKPSFSTNTTVTVQVPSGGAIPTFGGVSAVSYSTQAKPYGFPQKGAFAVESLLIADRTSSTPTNNTWYTPAGSWGITIPAGTWRVDYSINARTHATGSTFANQRVTLSTTTNTETRSDMTTGSGKDDQTSGVITLSAQHSVGGDYNMASAVQHYALHYSTVQVGMGATNGFNNNSAKSRIIAYPNFL